jgi:hypothetical protein
MRKGQNPAKFVRQVAKPERITAAVTVYVPFLSGYYAEMLEILKRCLASLRETAGQPLDLLVFDNASCEEVRHFLWSQHLAGNIQYLALSEHNIGKGGAWNFMFSAAPGEIIAYADSDVLFYPDWLSQSLRILQTFPQVGMVAARPFRTDPVLYEGTHAWAQNDPEAVVERGCFIPWEVFREFDVSLGQTEEHVRNRYEATEDVRITYRGLPVLAGASHWQFVAYKQVLAQFLPFEMSRPMGQVRHLDQKVNEAGLLRLMTTEALVRHMGNTLRGSDSRSLSLPSARSRRRRLVDLPPVRWGLMMIYDQIFKWYYER